MIQYGLRLLRNRYHSTLEANEVIRHQALQFLPFLIASFITGFVAFGYSRLFSGAEWLSHWLYGLHPFSIFIVTPVCFVASWWLVRRFAPFARGSGIPQVMAAVELMKPETEAKVSPFLSLRVLGVKIVSSSIKVVGGGILGREGPTIQIAASIFRQIYNWLPKWWPPLSQQNFVIAGAASGLAAAFNTPLGGIVFAIEELSRFHLRHYKSPLFIAVIIAGITAQAFGGSYLYLGYPKTGFNSWVMVPGLILVSVVCGYFASRMSVLMLKLMRAMGRVKKVLPQLGIVLFCALFVAIFIYWLGPEAMGSGKEIMERTLYTADKAIPWYLPFVRMNGLMASFTFGGAGGVFAPSLSAGACFGGWIAQLLELSGSNANLLILVGMTAFLTGVTRAPFTSAIILFEMTDRHSVIFFLLLGALLSNLVASLVDKHSFYDHLKESYLHEVGQG
ncbi:MAG: chloride channel protein [Sphingobacteriales bacterium]|nr:MAG: chloride channel protein [Sphingobacteriales bacterium]